MKLLKERISILAELKFAPLLPLVCCATLSLGQSPQQQAWEILQAGVNDKSTGKRTRAVRALGLMRGNRRAEEVAQRALEDEKPEVRAAAAVDENFRAAEGAWEMKYRKLGNTGLIVSEVALGSNCSSAAR